MRSAPHDLDLWRAGLITWFALVTALPEDALAWADEPQSMSIGTCGSLRPLVDVALGRPERQIKRVSPPAPAGAELDQKLGEPRALTLTLTLDGYDQRLQGSPFFTLRSATTKMRSPESLAALRELGLAIIGVGRVQNVPRKESGRTFPRAICDLRLGYTNVETLDPMTFIERARLTSHVRDADGVELPSPPNQTVEVEVT